MNTIEATGKIIHIYGRDENKNFYHKEVKDFKPYFYVPASEDSSSFRTESVDKLGLDGEKVKKVYCNQPGEVRGVRERFNKTYEADVTYVNRYLIDKVDKIKDEPLRICFIDIETQIGTNKVPNVKDADMPITSICCYDSFLKKYITFYWHKDPKYNTTSSEASEYGFTTEKKMIETFIRFVQGTNPDMFVAWYGDEFDFKYIINRLGKDADKLARVNGSSTSGFKAKIGGRSLFDMYWGYRRMIPGEKESFKLGYIGEIELGLKKIEYSGSLDELWKNDLRTFLDYNKRDVEILVGLEEKLGIIEYHNELRKIAKCTFDDTFQNSRIVDFYILNFTKDRYALPTTIGEEREDKVKGAYVVEPKVGLHENICVGDLKSLYPSISVSFNMSPETVSEDGDIDIGNGIKFSSKTKGILPEVFLDLFKIRKMYKEQRDKHEYESSLYTKFDTMQYSTKVLLNSIYGVMLFPRFRLYKREVGKSITYMGRKIIQWTKKEIEQRDCNVVYGDTDSVFFELKEKPEDLDVIVKGAEKIIAEVNESYDEMTKEMNIKSHILKLEFKKVYKTLFFSRSKKRYAGLMIWKEGKEMKPRIDVVGFDMVRSDNSYISKMIQKKVLEMVLKKKPKIEIISFVRNVVNKIKSEQVPIEDLALPKGVTKPLDKYHSKGLPIHVRASVNANKFHNAGITEGTKVKYVHIIHPRLDVIAFESGGLMWKDYKIDYNLMIEKTIFMKLERIFDSLGWSIDEIKGQSNLDKWF